MSDLPQNIDGLVSLVIKLRAEIDKLGRQLTGALTKNDQLVAEVAKLRLELTKIRSKPPFHPQPDTPVLESLPKSRKKRVEAFVRRRSVPTTRIIHAVEICPGCQVKISGLAVDYRREVIDLPDQVVPQITEHVILKRYCWKCGKKWVPQIDWNQLVVGQSRFGVNLVSRVATMRESLRLPIRAISAYLDTVYSLHLSGGEIVKLLHRVADRGETSMTNLQHQLVKSKVVCSDETGWRENGKNSYLWSHSTPTIRYFLHNYSRGSPVVKEVLGEEFGGVVSSDFYGAYNVHAGDHQRCWAHFSRDVKDLTKWFPDQPDLARIKLKLEQLFTQGKDIQTRNLTLSERHLARRKLEKSLLRLAKPYLSQKTHPFHTLAKRIDRFVDEMFTFVLDPDIPPTNNQAERSLRPVVISRKISGGTRSPKGSKTKAILATLFGTWQARNLNPLAECKALLTNPNYAF